MTKLVRPLVLMTALAVLTGGAVTSAQDKAKPTAKDEKKKEKTGTIEIYKAKDGGFRYRIKNGDGKVVAMPPLQKSYETKEDVQKALDDLKATLNTVKPTEVKD